MQKTTVPFEIQYLENKSNIHLILNVKIGRKQARMVIDTGASHSCISPELAKPIPGKDKIEVDYVASASGNDLSNEIQRVPSVKIGDFTLKNYQFLVLDISHINLMFEKLNIQPIVGFLGSDILLKYHAVIDYNTRTLYLSK